MKAVRTASVSIGPGKLGDAWPNLTARCNFDDALGGTLTITLLVGAMMALIGGVVLQVWTLRPARAGAQYALQLPVVLLYALSGSSLLFLLFPDSVSEGRAAGFALGGAAGFVGFFMISSFAWLSRTRKMDALLKRVAHLESENRAMSRRLAITPSEQPLEAPPVAHERVTCQLRESRKFQVGFITGSLSSVTGIDVWVNSENTRMEMSRVTEPTISAAVRYLGSVRDEVGRVVKDSVADELRDLMGGESQVPAGHVLATSASNLEATHGTKRILHVAAVEGELGRGYRPVQDIGNCVRNVLSEIDRLNNNGEKLRSAVVPLFGTGGGNSDLPRTAQLIVTACVDYLSSHRASQLRAVYLLAHTGAHVAACEDALAGDPRLSPLRD